MWTGSDPAVTVQRRSVNHRSAVVGGGGYVRHKHTVSGAHSPQRSWCMVGLAHFTTSLPYSFPVAPRRKNYFAGNITSGWPPPGMWLVGGGKHGPKPCAVRRGEMVRLRIFTRYGCTMDKTLLAAVIVVSWSCVVGTEYLHDTPMKIPTNE